MNNSDRQLANKIDILHAQACSRGEDTYQDPQTGFTVFTKQYHLQRGYCCESGCRHCPYKVTSGTCISENLPNKKEE